VAFYGPDSFGNFFILISVRSKREFAVMKIDLCEHKTVLMV